MKQLVALVAFMMWIPVPVLGQGEPGVFLEPEALAITSQAGDCTYSINPTSATVAAAATNGTVSVTASSGCSWTATSNAGWITVTEVGAETARTLDSTGQVGLYTSVAIGTDNNPVISYYDHTNGDLKVYVCADAACASGTARTLDSTGAVGLYTSIAIGTDNNPVISHFDNTNGDLKVYVCADAACTDGTARTIIGGIKHPPLT
jgi:hypothetical protein